MLLAAVALCANGPRNVYAPENLAAAADYIERALNVAMVVDGLEAVVEVLSAES